MTQTIALIDYGAGNVRSMANALAEAGRRSDLDVTVDLTSDPDRVAHADRIVLPGVGAFGACRAGIDAVDGLYDALHEAAIVRGRPFFGVCVGMQLLATSGAEHGSHAGFDWMPGVVDRLTPDEPRLKIPHMGWNTVAPPGDHPPHPVFAPLVSDRHVYFVHAYHFKPQTASDTTLLCDYGGLFSAAVARDTLVGAQFHPEKSQRAGLGVLSAFLQWSP